MRMVWKMGAEREVRELVCESLITVKAHESDLATKIVWKDDSRVSNVCSWWLGFHAKM